MKIEAESELERLTSAREAELKFVKEQNEMELAKSRETAEIETVKFKQMVDAIGSSTLQAIATAGPDLQVRMLQALGMKSTVITDGTTPVNLFNTAQGLIGGIGGGHMVPSKRARRNDDDEDDD
jgi:major vault protein